MIVLRCYCGAFTEYQPRAHPDDDYTSCSSCCFEMKRRSVLFDCEFYTLTRCSAPLLPEDLDA